jgi:hypothetical protein
MPLTGARAHSRLASDLALWAILALQVGISIVAARPRALWLDEAYSALMARKSFAEIRAALAIDAGPPLYYDLLHLWRGLFGESETALRSLSLLFALATTVLLYRLALRLFDRSTAVVSTLLWAAHPLVAFYANEARSYMLFAFLSLAFASALCERSDDRRPGQVLAIAASLIALAYTHNIGGMAAAAALLAGALVYRRAMLDRWVVLALGVAAACYVPWIPTLRRQLAHGELTIWWMRGFWSPWSPLESLGALTPFGRGGFLLDVAAAPAGWWPVVALSWVLPAGAALLRRADPAARHIRFLALYLALGLAIPATWSALRNPIVMPGRTDFFLLPVFALLVAAGLRAARPWLRVAGPALLAGCALTATALQHGRTPSFDEREWVGLLQARGRPGDVVVCTNLTRAAAEYYLIGTGVTLLSFPQDMARELAHFNADWYERNLDLAADAGAVVSRALAAIGEGRRLWVVALPHALNGALLDALVRSGSFAPEAAITSPRMGMQRIDMPVELLPFTRNVGGAGAGQQGR